MTMKQILLAASVLLIPAGGALAQVVVADPQIHVHVPPIPAVTVPPIPWVAWGPQATTVEHLASAAQNAAREGAKWAEQGAKWAEQAAPFAQVGAQPFRTSQIESVYSQARNYIDRNQYDRALDPLDRVIAARGERADAAMYWKAYTLWKLARRDEALSTVGQIQKQFPESRWLRDARALEVEIKQASGQTPSTDAADDDVKLLAVQGIMRTDPEAGLPVIEKMLTGGGSVRLKERALFVLSQNRSDRARDIIAGVAKGNANPDLQLSAIRLLAQSNSPEAIATLSSLYRADQSMETRRAIVTALSQSHNNAAAINALITIARTERNADLKMQIVRHLSNSRTPEAKAYMLELLK